MSRTYFTPPEVAGQGVKAVHQWPDCANEDSHIVGRFDAKYAYATFPKLELTRLTPTPPSSLMLTTHLTRAGPGASLSLTQIGLWSTPGQRRHRDALGAFTSFMPWKYP